MNRTEVDFLLNLLSIYSPSGKEDELATFLADKMSKELGFSDVRIDQVKNVVGEVGSGRPTILLCGHMDTVPRRLKVGVGDGQVYGRGAVDAKSSLASLILAASHLSDDDRVGRIVVAAVADEEGRSRGIKELVKSSLEADYAVFGEPSGVEKITIGYKGRVALKLMCRASSVHASAPWMVENAIERLYEVWERIKEYMSEKGDEKNRYRSLTACLTKIHGGTSHNVTPGRCQLMADIRVPPQYSSKQISEEIGMIVDRFRADPSFPRLLLEIFDATEPYEVDRTSPLLRAFTRAILEVRKKRPQLLKKTGTGDMNVFASERKIPALTYGPGNPHLSHTDKEVIEISEFLSSIDIYYRAILNLFTFTRQ